MPYTIRGGRNVLQILTNITQAGEQCFQHLCVIIVDATVCCGVVWMRRGECWMESLMLDLILLSFLISSLHNSQQIKK
jgi:hypothetical protein